MKFSVQPSNVPAHAIMVPAVVVELKNPSDADSVNLSLAPNSSGAVLSGTLTRATAGSVIFDDLSVDRGGFCFHLVATANAGGKQVSQVASDPFDVR